MLVDVGDDDQGGQDIEAAGPGDIRRSADEVGRVRPEHHRAGTRGSRGTETAPAAEEIDAAGEIVGGVVDITAACADQGKGAGTGELSVDVVVGIILRLSDQEGRGEALQGDRSVEVDVVTVAEVGRGQIRRDELPVGVIEIQRRVRDADRTAQGAGDSGRLVDVRSAVDRRRSGDDDVVREGESRRGNQAQRGARVEGHGAGAERGRDRADFERAGIDRDGAGEAGIGVGEDEITPALLAETVGPGERGIDDGAGEGDGAEPAPVGGEGRRVGTEREREPAAQAVARGSEDESADRDGIRAEDRAAGAAEISGVRIRESVRDRGIQTCNETPITSIHPSGRSQIPGSRSADAGVDPIGVPEDVGGASLRW